MIREGLAEAANGTNFIVKLKCSSSSISTLLQKKKSKTRTGMPNKWRTINSWVHKIRLYGRRGQGTAGSFSRENLRQAPQKEGREIPCDFPPV